MEIIDWRWAVACLNSVSVPWAETDGNGTIVQPQTEALPDSPSIDEVVAASRDDNIPSLTMEQLREAFNGCRDGNSAPQAAEEIIPEEGVAVRAGAITTESTQCSIMGRGVGGPPPNDAGTWQTMQPLIPLAPLVDEIFGAEHPMRYAMLTFRPGAVRVAPESSDGGCQVYWRDPADGRIREGYHGPAPSWYDTLPDDTACSLEEWNAKVDALLDDMAEFHRAIDGEDGETE